MPTGTVMPLPRQQFFDANGDPLASGTLETYEAGTTTLLATYSDSALTVANPTTITLNSAGRPQVSGTEVGVFLAARAYRFILKTSAGVTVWTADNIYALQPAASVNLELNGTAGEALVSGDLVYLSNGSDSKTAGRWYKADGDLVYASVDPILGFATTAIASGAVGLIRTGGLMDGFAGLTAGSTYYASGTAGLITLTAPAQARPVGVAASATELVLFVSPRLPDVRQSMVCEGRMTLTTAVPVTAVDVTAATTVYFTPHLGNRIALYDGSNRWIVRTFSEVSIALGADAADTNYDLFAYDVDGTVTLERLAWTNATTRATALVTQNGVLVKSGVTTRRYLGTYRTTGVAGQTEDSFAKRYNWNMYNRVPRPLRVMEATASWTYTTATWRQARATATNQLDVVVGQIGVAIDVRVSAALSNSTPDTRVGVAIGEDSTTVMVAGSFPGYNWAQTSNLQGAPALYQGVVPLGRHFYAWLEYSEAVGTTTWAVSAGAFQSGISGMIEG